MSRQLTHQICVLLLNVNSYPSPVVLDFVINCLLGGCLEFVDGVGEVLVAVLFHKWLNYKKLILYQSIWIKALEISSDPI